jgi:hypothetical protein
VGCVERGRDGVGVAEVSRGLDPEPLQLGEGEVEALLNAGLVGRGDEGEIDGAGLGPLA